MQYQFDLVLQLVGECSYSPSSQHNTVANGPRDTEQRQERMSPALMSWTLHNCWYFIRDYVDSFRAHTRSLYTWNVISSIFFFAHVYVQPENYGVEMCIRQEHIIYAFKGCYIYHSRVIFSAVPLRIARERVRISHTKYRAFVFLTFEELWERQKIVFFLLLRYDRFKSKILDALNSANRAQSDEEKNRFDGWPASPQRKFTKRNEMEWRMKRTKKYLCQSHPVHGNNADSFYHDKNSVCVPLLSYIMRSNGMERLCTEANNDDDGTCCECVCVSTALSSPARPPA